MKKKVKMSTMLDEELMKVVEDVAKFNSTSISSAIRILCEFGAKEFLNRKEVFKK